MKLSPRCVKALIFMDLMAESEGFEPPVAFRLRLISSQVHSTGLCQLSAALPDALSLTLVTLHGQTRAPPRRILRNLHRVSASFWFRYSCTEVNGDAGNPSRL